VRQTCPMPVKAIPTNPFRFNDLENAYETSVNSMRMSARNANTRHRSRELRRRVVLPARLRTGAHWSDTCILNISSRGLMIHSARAVPKGSLVELRRGVHVILARVVWKDGGRVGLRSSERLPIDEILSLNQSWIRGSVRTAEARRGGSRGFTPSLSLAPRALEFIGVCAIVMALAVGAWTISQGAFARPLAAIATALTAQN
jgi:hypothetical protein